MQPTPFPLPPSPPLIHPSTIFSRGSHPSNLSRNHLSPGTQHRPPGGSPKLPAAVRGLHRGRGRGDLICTLMVHSRPALPASTPKSRCWPGSLTESGPCRLPQGHPVFQLHFLSPRPFRLFTCHVPWSLHHRTLTQAGSSAWITALLTSPTTSSPTLKRYFTFLRETTDHTLSPVQSKSRPIFAFCKLYGREGLFRV